MQTTTELMLKSPMKSMRATRLLAMLLFALCANVSFAQSMPTEASIDELLTIMNARAAIDNVIPQVEGLMRNAMQQALGGKSPTPEQQKVMEEMQTRIEKLYGDEFNWDKMRLMYLHIYQKSFTQTEVDGMLSFYRSPAGQAVIKKMPLVMQNTMGEMQKMIGPMMQKAQAAAREAQARMAAEKANQPKTGSENIGSETAGSEATGSDKNGVEPKPKK